MSLWAFLRLTRPVFLVGGALAYGLGAALARSQGNEITVGRYLLGQALVTTVQLTAQYANEYYDIEPDRTATRTWFSGGSGVLPQGLLAPAVALRSAQVATATAVGLIVLVGLADLTAAAVGAAALAGAWAYSAPPIRLVAGGWGELVASLIVAGLTPLAGLLINEGTPNAALGWSAAALVGVHFSMIVALSLPDLEADRATAKRTLAVRLGRQGAGRAHLAGLVTAAVAIAAGLLLGALPAGSGLAGVAALAGALTQRWAIGRSPAGDTVLTLAAVATFAVLAAGLLVATMVA